MMTKTVSLIVATRWRTSELRKFLDSLVIQTYKRFNVIVVDQNDDDRVQSLLQEYESRLSITHVRSSAFGKAAANNVGLRICDGEFVAFPDDDCWYAPDLLNRVVDMFERHPGMAWDNRLRSFCRHLVKDRPLRSGRWPGDATERLAPPHLLRNVLPACRSRRPLLR